MSVKALCPEYILLPFWLFKPYSIYSSSLFCSNFFCELFCVF
jgi:hypothetical protein